MARRHFALFKSEDHMDDSKFMLGLRDAHISSHSNMLNKRRSVITPRRGRIDFQRIMDDFLRSEDVSVEQLDQVVEELEDE